MQEIYHVLTPGGRLLRADFGRPEGLLLSAFFAPGTLVQADEARYIQDNPDIIGIGREPVIIVLRPIKPTLGKTAAVVGDHLIPC